MLNLAKYPLKTHPKIVKIGKSEVISVQKEDHYREKKPYFKSFPSCSSISTISNKQIKYSKKIIKPTYKEIQLHKDFLKNELKKNFFN